MSRVYNEDIIKTFESCVLHRFKGLRDLREYFNMKMYYDNLKVKDIAKKIYYDSSDESDYEILLTLGNDEEDIYDLTIYYAKTRIGDNIIVEIGYEEV